MLIDELKSRKNSAKTLETKIALICRMIKFAQGQQPDYAFPLVSITIEGKNPQLNKRSHILAPGEMEFLVGRQIQAGNVDAALVLALIGFAGMRPIEIMYLQKGGITLLPNALEINIERSKTPAGKRCLPIHALAPKAMHDFLLKELTKRCNSGESADVFFEDNVVKAERREKLITHALVALREEFGEGIDLYTLRHSFASWSFVRLVKAAHGDTSLLANSPNLQHEIFRSGLKPFAELVFQQRPYFVDPSSFYRLARLMGHATPETLPRTYLHSVGLVHSAFLGEVLGTRE
jgi:integrase